MYSKKILIYGMRNQSVLKKMREGLSNALVYATAEPEEARRVISDIEIVFAWKLPPDIYARASHLEWIQSMGAGVDDLMANPEIPQNVIITRIVGQFGGPIAEYVFAELLYRERNLEEARRLQELRLWRSFDFGTLKGKVIGVAGLGSIGQEIVRVAQTFDMTVYGLSRHRHEKPLDRTFDAGQWTEFVRGLDYLVLALPLTPDTAGRVDARVFKAMKPGAVVINVGRGQTVNQDDLTDALEEGVLAGAILDVFEDEPLPKNSPLWALQGVVVTPHISGPSHEGEVASAHPGLAKYAQTRASG
jgi:glyoxylate/hydroxypyruvate reductase A